ncbi:MAG: multiubiquitin domain-containing protein [Erythrobacter sp.]|nr:multiubiquitin domain-containing protein [Erythrobacter sp.]
MIPLSENAVAEAARGAPTRYRIEIGNDRLEYYPAVIDDPVPTGLQILELAKARPADEHIVFQLLANGLLEELRPDETTDLRTVGVEKFLVFRSDRSFRLELDGRVFEWGGVYISGRTLKTLAQVDPADYGVWLEVRGAEDRPIGDTDLVDLSAQGIERFFTGIVKTTEG